MTTRRDAPAEPPGAFERAGARRPRRWLWAGALVAAALVAALVAVDDPGTGVTGDELPVGDLDGGTAETADPDDATDPADPTDADDDPAPDDGTLAREDPPSHGGLEEADTAWEHLPTPPEALSAPVVVTSDADATGGQGLSEEALVLGGRADADDDPDRDDDPTSGHDPDDPTDAAEGVTLALDPDREAWDRRGRIPLAEVREAWRDEEHLIAFGTDEDGAFAAARAHPRGHGWERLPDPPPGELEPLGVLDGELWLLPDHALPREAPAETAALVLEVGAEQWRREPTPFAPTTAGPSSVQVDDRLIAVSRTPDDEVASRPAWASLDAVEGWSEPRTVPSRTTGWTPRIVPWAQGGGLILGPAPEDFGASAAWEWDASGAISRTLVSDPPLEWWRVEVLPAGEQVALVPAARYREGYRAPRLGADWQRLPAPPDDVGWHPGAVASTGDGLLAVGDADTIDEPGAAWLHLP